MQKLSFSNPYRLCWQSQVGPSAWLGPQTAETVTQYVSRGQKNLVLIPIAFTSDHIETLYELDREVIAHCGAADTVKRADSLNGSETFIQGLADLAAAHLAKPKASVQLSVRCPGCVSERCARQKRVFCGVE